MNDVMKAIEIKKAILLFSDLLGIEPAQVVARVCLTDKEKQSIFVDASKVWNKFDDATLEERAKMMGFTLTEYHHSRKSPGEAL